MDIAGYLASIFIGIVLGLIGSGGSILTVPVLVYLFSIEPSSATTYSLFIVGTTSLVGSVSYLKKKLVDLKMALVFGLPSIAAVFFTRRFILPAIPQKIIAIGNFNLTKENLLMLLFAALMVAASYSMIKKSPNVNDNQEDEKPFNYPLVVIQGVITGIITGLIGAGGGFLIIPALVNFLKIPMKKAIGTSLVIITFNSLVGFAFSLNSISLQWYLLLGITGISILGILVGSYLSTKVDSKKLKPAFGWFVLAMGIYIIIKETIF